jgi:hypothetical protein
MKNLSLLAFTLASCAVLADVGLRQGGTAIGPARDLDCGTDGGLYCTRASGSTVGKIQCVGATATETGCVTVGTQTVTGDKTIVGVVKANGVDAGWLHGGSVQIEGTNVISSGTGTTLLIRSDTADSVTSSTVASITLKAGADITSTDQIFDLQDSSGNHRLRVTESGTANFSALATDTGASTVSGTNFTAAMGNGGAASGATPAGTGGAFSLATGNGGAASTSTSAGTGGSLTLSTGSGGNNNGAQLGGAGGDLTVISGAGVGGSSSGAVSIRSGQGGNQTTAWLAASAGTVSISAGAGGTGTTSAAGNGGTLSLTAGAGGTGNAAAAGAGGAVTIQSGGGGTVGTSGGASGAVTIDTGAATGALTNGSMTIGATNAEAITLGRTTKTVSLPGVLRSVGVATGSLPTCDSTSPGALEYDTTVARMAICDNFTGSYAWRYLLARATTPKVTQEATFSAVAFGTAVADTNFVGGFYNQGALTTNNASVRIQCASGTAGVVGGAATGVVVDLHNVTDGAEVCSCTLSSGTSFCSAVSTLQSCTCTGPMPASKAYTIRLKSTTDCGTKPGNMVCTVYYQKDLDTGTYSP